MSILDKMNRRELLGTLGRVAAGAMALMAVRPVRAAVKQVVSTPAPPDYDPTKHHWRMFFDVDKCIGCGKCVDACKTENHVPREAAYFRTWIERYIIRKPKPGSVEPRGETVVDSPNGGMEGFPPSPIPKEDILKSFFVPKICNQCEGSPCVQCCPTGASFDAPDGVVLVDPTYCIGCGFCVQSCPYGCRFINPMTKTAEKCTFCYHRITRGLKPACVEVCPTGARDFADMKNPESKERIEVFVEKNKVQVLKPHLGTRPQLIYANLDQEVR